MSHSHIHTPHCVGAQVWCDADDTQHSDRCRSLFRDSARCAFAKLRCKPWFLRSMVTPLTAVRRMHLHFGLVKAQSSQSEGWSKATWLVSGLGACNLCLQTHTNHQSIHSTTQPLDPLRLQGLWTLLAECFAAFVHTTCLLSVPGQYATLGRIQDPRSNCSLKPLDSWRQWEPPFGPDRVSPRDYHPSLCLIPENAC